MTALGKPLEMAPAVALSPLELARGTQHAVQWLGLWTAPVVQPSAKGVTQLFDHSHLAATLCLWTQLPDGEGIGRERLHLGTDALGLIKAEFIYTQGPNQLYNLLHACWR